ncbi:hypothetical protein H3H36_18710 [Duganella sp. FT3S]|uniref:Uncharacterized protein n=1 Tax=Rugamonas fusca TaxID=2758568 RepID=A0A7W2EKB6_9BURK|nr:hypothetical protein [Rugamonas fusca]MBA5607392.1 hypothetical protein [Rugamonas fusca]
MKSIGKSRPKIDRAALKKKAEKLARELFIHAKHDNQVKCLLGGLLPFIEDAIAERVDEPLRWADMPGAYFFNEGHLRKYSDLESAYAEFKLEMTGGETPALRKLREEIRLRNGITEEIIERERNAILNKLDMAIQETETLLLKDKDPLLSGFLKELQRYVKLTRDHWPLSSDEKMSVDIGRVAVREFDNTYPSYCTLLSNVGALLRGDK